MVQVTLYGMDIGGVGKGEKSKEEGEKKGSCDVDYSYQTQPLYKTKMNQVLSFKHMVLLIDHGSGF